MSLIIPATLDELALVEYNPTVTLGEVSFTAGVDELALVEYNPTVNKKVEFTAGVDALVIAEHNPVDPLFWFNVAATVDTLAIATFNPTVLAGIEVFATRDILNLRNFLPQVSMTLPDLASELYGTSRMTKELKGSSEMTL